MFLNVFKINLVQHKNSTNHIKITMYIIYNEINHYSHN